VKHDPLIIEVLLQSLDFPYRPFIENAVILSEIKSQGLRNTAVVVEHQVEHGALAEAGVDQAKKGGQVAKIHRAPA
jgi:hypothetical protein